MASGFLERLNEGALPYHVRAMAEAIGKPTELPDRPGPYQMI